MARIAGVNLPLNKRVEIGLTYIYGVGRPAANKLLAKTNVKHEIKTFPGTEHGFAFPERAVYSTLAAEETWDKMFAMWDRTLKG